MGTADDHEASGVCAEEVATNQHAADTNRHHVNSGYRLSRLVVNRQSRGLQGDSALPDGWAWRLYSQPLQSTALLATSPGPKC